jgi:hypothetical protein
MYRRGREVQVAVGADIDVDGNDKPGEPSAWVRRAVRIQTGGRAFPDAELCVV